MKKCQFCGKELPDNARFCHKCRKQIVCAHCGETLLLDAAICVVCGNDIASSASNHSMNEIEYSRSDNSEKFSAKFSDTTAGNVVQTFVALKKQSLHDVPYQEIQALPSVEKVELKEDNHSSDSISEVINSTPTDAVNLANIGKIFTDKNGNIILKEKRLKSKTALEQSYRIALLFIYYQKLHGQEDVKRTDVNTMISNEKLQLSNFRTWFTKNQKYFIINNGDISLSPEGVECAEQILAEVFDDTISNSWSPSNNKSQKNSASNKSTKSNTPQIVKELNLVPKDKDSLSNFMGRYKYNSKSNPTVCLLFIYYLTKVCSLTNINQNHIYTCYKEMKIAVPNNIYQCLSDASHRKGWFENVNNLRTTVTGENEVELKMKKK